MKTLFLMLLSGITTLSAMAQTVTLTFNGANKNRNYQVVIDGTSYYSNSTSAANNSSVKKLTVGNLSSGSHTLMVYRQRNNNVSGNTNPSGQAVYTNSFTTRVGYDMDIKINGNGGVSFTEKQIRNRGRYGNRGNQQNVIPMADVTYNELLQSVRSKWTQGQKIGVIQQAFNNTANYFTTAQVRTLLQFVSTESNRLAIAKLAYPRVTDPNNFTTLYDLFNSTASRDDMNLFMRNNPNYNNTNNNGNYNNNNNNSSYKTPMADYQFTQLAQNVSGQYDATSRYNLVRDAFSNYSNYFSTAQIRQLLLLINTENERLALAKMSYLRVSDPANFTTLYDVLNTQAARNELNYHVIQNGGTGVNTNTQYNTRVAVTDALFTQILQKASNHFLPWDKVRDVREAFNNTSYYFTTAQIRQLLQLAASEGDRLDLAKLAWSRVSDPTYFTQLYDMFSSQASKDDLNAYITAHPF